jgi:hypothetical protein
MFASHRRSITTPMSPYSLAVGRPLQSESLCALVSGAIHQRTQAGGLHRPASVSYGRKATLLILTSSSASPGRRCCAPELLWKLISDLSSSSIVDTTPSGMFPSGGVDSRAAISPVSGGEDKGLDCFSFFSPRVCFVKVTALSVNSQFVRGFDVSCNPPPY